MRFFLNAIIDLILTLRSAPFTTHLTVGTKALVLRTKDGGRVSKGARWICQGFRLPHEAIQSKIKAL